VFDLSLADEILGVDPSQGLRAVTYAHRGETLRVPVDTVAVLDDMDTQDDYERLK
jgi:CTP:molybdopterin cytidylyltransferase MocA